MIEAVRYTLRGHALFAKRLATNFGIGLWLILASLFVGMLGYRYFEGLRWVDSFSHAAMILGGMGPYVAPKTDGGKLFEGFYALYSGLCTDRRHWLHHRADHLPRNAPVSPSGGHRRGLVEAQTALRQRKARQHIRTSSSVLS